MSVTKETAQRQNILQTKRALKTVLLYFFTWERGMTMAQLDILIHHVIVTLSTMHIATQLLNNSLTSLYSFSVVL